MKKNKQPTVDVKRVGRFGLVGILNTIVDFVILNVLVVTVLPKSSVLFTITLFGVSIAITGIIVAGLISGTAAMINSYIFNMRFTFRKRHIDSKHTFYFFAITIFGLYVIRPIILKVMTDIWIWPADIAYAITSGLRLPLSRDFDERNLALMVAIMIILVYNYLMYKHFVFNNEKK